MREGTVFQQAQFGLKSLVVQDEEGAVAIAVGICIQVGQVETYVPDDAMDVDEVMGDEDVVMGEPE